MSQPLRIDTNIPDVVREFDRLRRDQVPFATATAVNTLAREARERETQGIFERFKVRRPGRLAKSTAVTSYAKKAQLNPSATVTVRDTFLVQHEQGGTRRRGDVYRSMPQPIRATERRVGVLHGRTTPGAVLRSDRKAFVARTRSGKFGVFRRIGKRRLPIELIYSYEREVKLPKLLKFGATVQGVAVREWERVFGASLAAALATRR